MDIKDLKEIACEAIEKQRKELTEISKYIHSNPEYCFEEYKACKILINYLEKEGFIVEAGICDLSTAFKGTYKGEKSGYNIGIFAEYDAVAGLGHGCGHNIMAAMAVGTAMSLKEIVDKVGGTVSVFGTPAEEGGGGKIIMLEKGAFKDLDAAMILHPANDTVVNDISYSRTDLEVNFYGKSSHAATFPDQGTSALNPLIQLFNMVNAMRLELMEKGKILGVITKGGYDPIYIPDHCIGKFTIRSFDMKFKLQLVDRFIKMCQSIAEATNTIFKYEVLGHPYEDIRNNEAIEALLEENLKALGEVVKPRERELGIGCTDMGNVTHCVPALQSYIKVCDGAKGHTMEFLQACSDERGEKALITGAKAMAMTAVDLLYSHENMKKVKLNFQEMKKRFEYIGVEI